MPIRIRLATRIALLGLTVAAARAAATTDQPAALLTLPYVTVDAQRGVDTALRISNVDDVAVDVVCALENATGSCLQNPALPCLDDAHCPTGDVCAAAPLQVTQFGFRLTADQPLGWQLSSGIAALPLPANTGSIPPAPLDPFRGTLRCFAADGNGRPVARNVLIGDATLETAAGNPLRLDAAGYNAIGLAAQAPFVDDGVLQLGGPDAEYDACPVTLRVNHFFDHAIDPASHAAQIFTNLALVTCAADVGRAHPDPELTHVVTSFLVYNEFEQRFSTSAPLRPAALVPLSRIDTAVPERSIFSAGVAGTLSGQTIVEAFGGGVLGVAVQTHRDTVDPDRASSAAFTVHPEGESPAAIQADFTCSKQPMSTCQAAERSDLTLRQRGDAVSRLAWEWRGSAAGAVDFGDPQHTTRYAFCLYGGNDRENLELAIPPDATRWSAVRTGVRYGDRGGEAAGVTRVTLNRGRQDRVRVTLRASGPNLPPLSIDDLPVGPLVLQLVNSETGTCFASAYGVADVQRTRPGVLEAELRP